MAVRRNNFDAGTDGSGGLGRITPANSSNSGDPLELLVDTSAQRWNYAAHPLGEEGLVAYRTNDTTSAHIRGHDPSPSGRAGMRRSFHMANAPSSGAIIAQCRTYPGESLIGSLQVDPDRRVVFNMGAGVGYHSASRSSVSNLIPLNEKIYAEVFFTPNATPANGTAEYYILDEDDVELFSWSGTVTTNVSPAAQHRLGGFNSSNGLLYDWSDEFAWGSLASGLFGPFVDAGPDQTVEPWSIVYLTETPGTQTSGPAVSLFDTGGGLMGFEAPPSFTGATIVFNGATTITVLPATDAIKVGGVVTPIRFRRGADL